MVQEVGEVGRLTDACMPSTCRRLHEENGCLKKERKESEKMYVSESDFDTTGWKQVGHEDQDRRDHPCLHSQPGACLQDRVN